MCGGSKNSDALHSLAEEEASVALVHLPRYNLVPRGYGFDQPLDLGDHALFLRGPRDCIFVLDRLHCHPESAGKLYANGRSSVRRRCLYLYFFLGGIQIYSKVYRRVYLPARISHRQVMAQFLVSRLCICYSWCVSCCNFTLFICRVDLVLASQLKMWTEILIVCSILKSDLALALVSYPSWFFMYMWKLLSSKIL